MIIKRLQDNDLVSGKLRQCLDCQQEARSAPANGEDGVQKEKKADTLDTSIGATFSAVSIHSSVPLSKVGLQGAGHPGTPADGQQDGSWIWICCWSFLGNEAAELRAALVRCRFHFIKTRLVDLAWQGAVLPEKQLCKAVLIDERLSPASGCLSVLETSSSVGRQEVDGYAAVSCNLRRIIF